MPETVLVTGATGRQGGATARALLAAGLGVRALVRDPDSAGAAALATAGAELVRGDLNDPASLVAAAEGARGVFSIQTPDLNDLMGDAETRQGANLAAAAKAAGVEQIVHTSVSGTGRDVPGLASGEFGEHMPHYWASKAAVEEAVRTAGVPRWTILRPATFMEMFVRPSFWFADWTSDRILSAVRPDTPLPLVAVQDIGTAAAAAFADPARFDRVELELAGDVRTLREIAEVMSEVLGTKIEPPSTTAEEALAQGLNPAFALSQTLMDRHPSPARPEFARALGLPVTTLREWAARTL